MSENDGIQSMAQFDAECLAEVEDYLKQNLAEGGVPMENAYSANDESIEAIATIKKEINSLRDIVEMLRLIDK